ncbi:MAG: AAA family ATPase [Cyanosarcina radialis HA8281-LM2]|nr:AAA family ATPase [Cyanosarcina radialis HA8281-LM2]
MFLKSLTLTNVRTFNHAEFNFQFGMNLLVGINAVGKSTVLDAIRILLSQSLLKVSQCRSKPLKFEDSDIAIDKNYLTAEIGFEIADTEFRYLVHQSRSLYIAASDRTGEVRDLAYTSDRRDLTPTEKEIPKSLKNARQQPLALYFSARRALANSNRFTSKAKGLAAAFADALDHRELRLMELADWWLAQTALAAENAPNAQRHLDALNLAISRTIDTCANLRVHRETFNYQDKNGKLIPKTAIALLIEKSGQPFDLGQLSDGERGILALALDLTRRLSQANPHLEDPLQAQAVVLIDELDLHLHPKWQRAIVEKLTSTFPNCQFIATTHSPQIIGEVPPESIILLEEGQPPLRPSQSLGMDTDWILKYLMGATTRNLETETELKRIADLIETEDYDEATEAIDTLRDRIGEFPELVRLQTRIDRLQLLGE